MFDLKTAILFSIRCKMAVGTFIAGKPKILNYKINGNGRDEFVEVTPKSLCCIMGF